MGIITGLTSIPGAVIALNEEISGKKDESNELTVAGLGKLWRALVILGWWGYDIVELMSGS